MSDKDHASNGVTDGSHHGDNVTDTNTSLEQSTSGRRRKRASDHVTRSDSSSNEKPNSVQGKDGKSNKITMQMLPNQLQKKAA